MKIVKEGGRFRTRKTEEDSLKRSTLVRDNEAGTVINIGDDINILVVSVKGKLARISITAPRETKILWSRKHE